VKKIAPLLIDTLYRASFSKTTVAGWRSNVDMRAALVAARRFVLDDSMSEFLGELATAAFVKEGQQNPALQSKLVEQLRVSARAPHRSVWIEYNLRKAMTRSHGLIGNGYDANEAPQFEGWLIEQHPALETAFRLHLFSRSPDEQDQLGFNAWTFPIVYTWTVDDTVNPWRSIIADDAPVPDSAIATGILPYNNDAVRIATSDLLVPLLAHDRKSLVNLLREWVGVLRRAWALLTTINDIPIIAKDVTQSRGFVARGRYRKFLDHKVLTLHVPQRDIRRVARQLIAQARRRAHQVRGHWRVDWRNPGNSGCVHEWQADQTCNRCRGHRLWIHEHQRGDAALGFVTHDYSVTHETEQRT
jgi:hypothetical protein